jgi:opacity protein-like surface antigen
MRTGAKAIVLALLILSLPTAAPAQTQLIAGGGLISVVDDETFLGRGPLISAGVAQGITSRLSAEAELSLAAHHRDAGYLASDGTPLVAAGRLIYTFRAEAGVRPFASGGLALVHSTGHLTFQNIVPGPDGRPVAASPDRRDWSLTQPAFELGGGVLVRINRRLAVRPEFRWIATGKDSSSRSAIEPPIWIARPSVSIVWRVR